MKNFYSSTKLDRRMETRRRIMDLSSWRDCILEALSVLAADYEAANMPSAGVKLTYTVEILYKKKILEL